MKLLRNYNEDDVLSKILLIYFAFQHGAIGVFFTFSTLTALQSKALAEMTRFLPMDVWGVILIMSALCFLFSALQETKSQYWLMIIAGITGMIVFSTLSMAVMQLSINQTNTINYLIISGIDIIIAILGGVALWIRRTL